MGPVKCCGALCFQAFGSANRVKSCDSASVDVSAGSLPKHWGLQVSAPSSMLATCQSLNCYFTPHFKAVHDTLTKSSQFLTPRVLSRHHLPCFKACMSFHCCLEPCGLEDFHDFSAQSDSLCQARRIQKPPTGHMEDLPSNRMSSVFEGRGSAGRKWVRSRYSFRPSNIDPVGV